MAALTSVAITADCRASSTCRVCSVQAGRWMRRSCSAVASRQDWPAAAVAAYLVVVSVDSAVTVSVSTSGGPTRQLVNVSMAVLGCRAAGCCRYPGSAVDDRATVVAGRLRRGQRRWAAAAEWAMRSGQSDCAFFLSGVAGVMDTKAAGEGKCEEDEEAEQRWARREEVTEADAAASR